MMIISFTISIAIMIAAIVGGNIADVIKHAAILFLVGIFVYVNFVLPPTLECNLLAESKTEMTLSLKVDGKPYNGVVWIDNKRYTMHNGHLTLPLEVDKKIKVTVPTYMGNRTCETILPELK